MEQSILKTVKKLCSVDASYTPFDLDIITHINSVFATLNQLGVGPIDGFAIEDDTATWDDFVGDNTRLSSVRSYVCLKVRMMFDPPTTSYLIEGMNKQISEFEWRMNVVAEENDWRSSTSRKRVNCD